MVAQVRRGPIEFDTVEYGVRLNSKQAERVRGLAKKAGISPPAYVQFLFDAAYAAKFDALQDTDLADKIRVAMILLGAGVDHGRIFEAIGVSETVGFRIVEGIKAELAVRS